MDIVSRQERSCIMGKVKSEGNKTTELKLLKLLRKNNITGWRRKYHVKGKPDFVFLKQRVAIFVDGCFWHGCEIHCRIPDSNQKYWEAKINRNKERDLLITNNFQKRDWKVIRIWEHELKYKNSIAIINYIKKTLSSHIR